MSDKINKSVKEWKKELNPEQYRVLRGKGTERAFTGEYNLHFEQGIYTCAGCGNPLFKSDHKYDHGCGWPSFYDALDKDRVEEKMDTSHGMIRTEIVCAKCGGHLGHVFPDGPEPTGVRYCVNSASLGFKEEK